MPHYVREVYAGMEQDVDAEVMLMVRRRLFDRMVKLGFTYSKEDRITYDGHTWVHLDSTFPDSIGRRLERFFIEHRVWVNFVIRGPKYSSQTSHFEQYVRTCLNDYAWYAGE